MKKTGQGRRNYNGFGGKVEEGETPEEAAVREVYEEVGLVVKTESLDKRATIDFHFPYKSEWDQRVHVYIADSWTGEPSESKEMKPRWFSIDRLPYHKMWDSDKVWLPKVLSGKKIKATFVWKEDNKTVDKYTIFG